MSNITFSTCWYVFKAKFSADVYKKWMSNMLANVKNYNLVVYTDIEGSKYILPYLSNPLIKLVIKPIEQFHMYKYKEQWISNHERNHLLNTKIDWKLNMLWSEKIFFVKETIEKQYFDTDYYGWCDIGYFRDITVNLQEWPNPTKIAGLNPDKIHYAKVNRDLQYMTALMYIISHKNTVGLPATPIPENQMSIAGGFFVLHRKMIYWWSNTYDTKLALYFANNYLVKDDQIIIIDCIFSYEYESSPENSRTLTFVPHSNVLAFTELSKFVLYEENNYLFDNWFMFQRILM